MKVPSPGTWGADLVRHRPQTVQRLVESGLIEARGEREGRSYHLSADVYSRLGQTTGYVRQRGFEPIQQEHMIRQYVEQTGKITRREAADLCRISPPQARRVLVGPVNRQVLEMRGKKKGAHYVLRREASN